MSYNMASESDNLFFYDLLKTSKEKNKSVRELVSDNLVGTDLEILVSGASISTIGIYFCALAFPFKNSFTLERFRMYCSCGLIVFKKSIKELKDLGFFIRTREKSNGRYLIRYILMKSVINGTIAKVFN